MIRFFAERFYGWTVVAAAFVIAIFGWGVGFYGPPVYLKAVQDARGWSVSFVSTAVTLHFLVGAVVVANLPRLHRRFGLPVVTIAGAVAMSLGVFGWATAHAPWRLLLATVLSGAGWVALGAAAINAMVSPWFAARRPAALAMAYNGASVGGVLFTPLWVVLIAGVGFQFAAFIVGATTVLVVAILATRILSRTPDAMGLALDGGESVAASPHDAAPHRPVAKLSRDPAFLTLSLGMTLGLFAQAGLIAHMFSLLVPALGAGWAGVLAGASTVAAIAGRTLVGWLTPQGADRRAIAAANYAVQIAGCAMFLAAGGATVPLLVAGVLLFGVALGNVTSLPPLIAQAEFAPSDTPRVVALTTAVAQATYAFGPAAFGLLRDLAGDAAPGAAPLLFIAAAFIQALAAAAYLVGRGRCATR